MGKPGQEVAQEGDHRGHEIDITKDRVIVVKKKRH